MDGPEYSLGKNIRKPPVGAHGQPPVQNGMSTDAINRDFMASKPVKTPGNNGILSSATQETETTHAKCAYLINHEFRALQLDKQIATMSVFDLIDHCALLFEQSTTNSQKNSTDAFKLYVRSFLIFNYFVNTFIMVHFNGFARFMETQPQDFIIYLNLYNFYRSDEIVAPDAFPVPPATVRKWTLEYLHAKRLLTFDVQLLYTWLDDYIEYLKNKEQGGSNVDFDDIYEEYVDTHEYPETGLPDDLYDFNARFPEVPALQQKTAISSRRPAETPYPVSGSQLDAEKSQMPPYPTEREISVPSQKEHSYIRSRPPVPAPPQPPQAPPHKSSSYALNYALESSPNSRHLKKYSTETSLSTSSKYLNHTPGHQSMATHHMNGATLAQTNNGYNHGRGFSRAATSFVNPKNDTSNIGSSHHKSGPRHAQAVCGLKNLGSSCYINSTIQLLVGLEPFEMAVIARKKQKGAHPLTEAIAGLITTFKANSGANIAPTKFLRVLSSLKPDFNVPFEQQDAQEFLLFLLDKLHEEMAYKPRETPVDYLKKWNITVNPRDTDEYLKWYRELLNYEGESPINDTFQGHVQSKLVCNKCGHRSVSYSPFTILSLPIPAGNNQTVDLTDCLRYFTQDEVLSGENAWNCPKCNKSSTKENPMDVVFQPKRGLFRLKRSKSPSKKSSTAQTTQTNVSISIKQLSFIKLPPVMFIHLSRFSMANVTDKLNTNITYPLRLKFNHHTHDIYYSLSGLINHYGTLKSGHYTSLVNKARTQSDPLADPLWCFFDDDNVHFNVQHGNVHSTDYNKLHSRDVYVLCYERV